VWVFPCAVSSMVLLYVFGDLSMELRATLRCLIMF